MHQSSATDARLLSTLQELLALPALDLSSALQEATQLVAKALECDKADAPLDAAKR